MKTFKKILSFWWILLFPLVAILRPIITAFPPYLIILYVLREVDVFMYFIVMGAFSVIHIIFLGYIFRHSKKLALITALSLELFLIMTFSVLLPVKELYPVKSSYEHYWVTKPDKSESIVRNRDDLVMTTFCNYRIGGWKDNKTVYFEENCGEPISSYFVYQIGLQKPEPVHGGLPPGLSPVEERNIENGNDKFIIKEYMDDRTKLLWIPNFSYSPDKNYIAVVVQSLDYRQEVYVIKMKK